METREEVLNRVRRRLNAARVHCNLTWEELFHMCDKNKDGSLDWREFTNAVRGVINVPSITVCDHDLKALFHAMDKDASQYIDIAELFDYVQRGVRSADAEQARITQRLQRVKKNIQMAFMKVSTNEADTRRLFKTLDFNADTRLSMYEFSAFVRGDLRLSKWDVMTQDLEAFYHFLDINDDGIDVEELLAFVHNKDKNNIKLGAQNFYKAPSVAKVKKCKTFRQHLIEVNSERLPKSASLPELKLTPCFASLGRDRRPASRAEATSPAKY